MENNLLDESQAGNKISLSNINNLSYTDDTTGKAGRQEEMKRLLRKVREESGKARYKLNIQITKIMAFVPSLQSISMETIESVTDFIFLTSNITAGSE